MSKEEIELLDLESREIYYLSEASAVQGPFIFFGCFLLAIALVFFFIKLPSLMPEKGNGTYLDVINQKNLIYGVFGIFFYVGAEVTIGSYLVNYFLDMNLVDSIKNNSIMNSIATFLNMIYLFCLTMVIINIVIKQSLDFLLLFIGLEQWLVDSLGATSLKFSKQEEYLVSLL